MTCHFARNKDSVNNFCRSGISLVIELIHFFMDTHLLYINYHAFVCKAEVCFAIYIINDMLTHPRRILTFRKSGRHN